MFKTKKDKIAELYYQILGRYPDESGLQSYINSNLSLEKIKDDLMLSSEKHNLLFNDKLLIDLTKLLNNKSKVLNFYDTDTEESFNKTKKKLGKDWIWYNKPITYELNSLGYRMKEFEDVDWSNYMAVFGCSFTAGTGMPLEDLWSTRISRHLKLDLVNAGIPGGANNTILINLNKLLSKKQPPKLIICNWTSITRWSYLHNDTIVRYGIGPVSDYHNYFNESYINYLQNDFQMYGVFIEIKRQVDTLCKYANIPVWHITAMPGHENNTSIEKFILNKNHNTINEINNLWARDFSNDRVLSGHPGYKYNETVYNRWLEIKHKFGF